MQMPSSFPDPGDREGCGLCCQERWGEGKREQGERAFQKHTFVNADQLLTMTLPHMQPITPPAFDSVLVSKCTV